MMKAFLLVLLTLTALLVLVESMGLVAALGVMPEMPSWPHDLAVRNQSGQRVKVTPVCVRPDGSPRVAKLYPGGGTQRMLDRVGGISVEAGATAAFVYDREYADLVAVIVEDGRGRLREVVVPAVAAGEAVTVDVDSLDALAPVSAKYVRVFDEAQRPRGRLWWAVVWVLTTGLAFVGLFVAYWRVGRRERTVVPLSV